MVHDYRLRVAAERGFDIYASSPEARPLMAEAGIPISGDLDDLLGQVDVIIDRTPQGIGAKNKEAYERAGIKAISRAGKTSGAASIEKTDRALGVVKSFLPKTKPEEAAHVAMGETLKAARQRYIDERLKGQRSRPLS